jgi:RNA-directed DNA polymerase
MSMYADDESDEGVVPMKRSNNGDVSSAETGEGRTSPKGNGGETAAARRRGTASNGLIAVRRVRFTALLHHITTDLLKQSYLSA